VRSVRTNKTLGNKRRWNGGQVGAVGETRETALKITSPEGRRPGRGGEEEEKRSAGKKGLVTFSIGKEKIRKKKGDPSSGSWGYLKGKRLM